MMKNIKKEQTEKIGLPCKSSARFVPVDECRINFGEGTKKNYFSTSNTYLITESEVVTGKSQSEALPY